MRKRFVSCLMAIIMVVCFLPTATNAGAIHLDVGPANVYVDGAKVNNISAYQDGMGEVRVESLADLQRIFPNDTETLQFLALPEFIVRQWAQCLGYSYYQIDNSLYITINGVDDNSETFTFTEEPENLAAEVFVNGIKLSDTGAYLYGGEFFIDSYDSLHAIFPKETAGKKQSGDMEVSSLRVLAKKYGYTMFFRSNRVYLNNDNHAPVEIILDGKRLTFSTQQAVLVYPGKTMISASSISNIVGCKVTWNSQKQRLTFKDGDKRMYFWIDNTYYWIDGNYYKMKVKPFISGNKKMVPLDYIAEEFGLTFEYDLTGTVPVVRLSSK